MSEHAQRCEYRRCGGRGLREVSPAAVRMARLRLQIGRASWLVCESCADLLVRERLNWGEAGFPVLRRRLPARQSSSAGPAARSLGDSSWKGDVKNVKKRSKRRARKRPKGQGAARAALERTKRRIERRPAKEPRHGSDRLLWLGLAKAKRQEEKRLRRTRWLNRHSGDGG